MTDKTADRIAKIRARADAATPGHWGVHYDGNGNYTIEAQPRLIPGIGNVREGVVATLHGEHGAEQPYRDSGFMARAREDVPFLLDRVAELEQQVKARTTPDTAQDVHTYFGLSYANYLVLPRTLLQSMPQEWQAKFVALVDEMDEAFQHVPQAECYKVEAVTEHIVNEMGHDLLEEAGITEDWYDEPVPEDLGPSDLNEWKAEHEKDAPTYYDRDGSQLDPEERVMLPAVDPVPHYDRGRTRVEPRLGGGE